MADITITVTGKPPKGEYYSSSGKVSSGGEITVDPGTTTIQFQRGEGQRWHFRACGIWFSDNAPFTIDSFDHAQVTITDTDPGGVDRKYAYRLLTNKGDFDPEIINKG